MLLDASSKRHKRRVLEMIVVVIRALALACRGHHELVLENFALRQQLNALRRKAARPELRTRDRLFWVVLAHTWRRWRSALVLVQPDTVMRWHREWLRRRWTRRSARRRAGHPSTDAAIAPSCTRWPPRIRSGERLGSMASWASWASWYRSEPSLCSSGSRVVQPHRRGGPS
jgi:hypothetical protein